MYVYALADPRTQQIRYIGVSKKVYSRYEQHIFDLRNKEGCNTQKNEWINDLKNDEMLPDLIILEEGLSIERAYEQERAWILCNLSLGMPLFNLKKTREVSKPRLAQPRKRKAPLFYYIWISGNEAAAIMTDNTDHMVLAAYVRLLARKGKIRSRAINARENEYYRGDVERYIVERRNKKETRTSVA